MKKHFMFLASAALVIAASCNKAEIDTPVEGAPVETEHISVQLNPETKTSLSGMETVWSEGDAVSVTVGGKNIGTLELVEGNTFSGEIEAGHDGEAVLNYPAGVTSVPAEQAAVAGTFANGAALLKGTTTLAALRAGEGATLSNTTALLSFSVAVAGDVVFTLGEATYTVKGCKAGETYYACVAPVAGAALSYTVAGADGLKSKAGVTFEAGLVYELGELSVPQASEWALVGVFSGWADKAFITTAESNVVVLKNVTMAAAEGFLVRKPATEWNDKYGAGSVNYLKADHYITTSKNGADMCLEAAGTYDIYFNVSTKNIYIMTAGTDYATAQKQTQNGKEPEVEEPEVTANLLYLKPNNNWKVDNARFAAYFFGGTPGEIWVSMSDSDSDGIYEVNIPEGYNYGCKVIFCRMNPNTTSNNWNNKWNQTGDLSTPTDGKNLYTITEGNWGDKGSWSVK